MTEESQKLEVALWWASEWRKDKDAGKSLNGYEMSALAMDEEITRLRGDLESAVNCIRDIASMSKKIGSETAANWLQAHGIPREDGGYVAGRGFGG